MAQVAAPWYPRLCPANSLAHVGVAHVIHKGETYDENVTYYRFVNSDAKSVKLQIKRLSELPKGLSIFNKYVTVPAREGDDFSQLSNDVALYSEDLRQHLKNTIDPILVEWLKKQMKFKPAEPQQVVWGNKAFREMAARPPFIGPRPLENPDKEYWVELFPHR